jgi:hypothetical protein
VKQIKKILQLCSNEKDSDVQSVEDDHFIKICLMSDVQ